MAKRCLLFVWFALAAAHVGHADSLYRAATFKSFVADARAWRVGDNLTVLITEFASVTTNARTATDKDGTVSGSLAGTNSSRNGSINLNEDFTGGGRIERSGKLTAQLTVVVEAIDPNGDLRVRGRQDISVNNEVQTLTLEGRVRPQDVGANNTVPSTRLSDAKISYTGDGLLAEKQRPGILTRFLSWLRIL
jgi:flagellar L-ring protein precursor FlgH